jgi:transposase
LVLTMIAEIEAERDAIVNEAAPQHPRADKIKALAELRSIGPEFATKLVGSVFYRSFDNRRQLSSGTTFLAKGLFRAKRDIAASATSVGG